MYRAIICLTEEHTAWVLPLSMLVCWVSCHTAFGLLKQARESTGAAAGAWLTAAGVAAGAGIWSTHFIAMLGYDPGVGVAYDLNLTLLSLAVSIAAAVGALAPLAAKAGSGKARSDKGGSGSAASGAAAASGVMLAAGIAGMHFLGMAGVRIPGRFDWDFAFVAAAIGCGTALTTAALLVFALNLTRHPRGVASTLLAAAIGALHFLSMAAAQAVPDPSIAGPAEETARGPLAVGVAAAMLTILAFSALTLFADHLRRANRSLAAQEAALRVSEERLARALEAGSDGLWDWNVATGETWFSDRWLGMLGYRSGELEGHVRTWERLINPADKERAQALLAAHFDGRQPVYECEHRLLRKDGGWGWVLARGKVVERDAAQRPLRIVGTHIDISARKTAEVQIAHMARHDGLTGLANRTHFHEALRLALLDADRPGGGLAVMILDCDRFKAVNDTFGHQAGDAVLSAIAQRIRAQIGEADVAARLGGDEFALLIGGAPTPDRLHRLAEALIAAASEPVPIGEETADIGLSIGIALAPLHGLDEALLFRRADQALYRAKAEGRGVHRIFDPAMDETSAQRRRLDLELRRAVADGGLTLHYQPQVLAKDGRVVGFEALVRWPHAERGLIGPADFIPLAEETGLIQALSEWVLREACREAAGWTRPLKVAVNLSPRQLQQADLPDRILAILAETGLAPGRLEIEITETALIADMSRALSILRRLKALGLGIAMDDFGTGYASLAMLQAFTFDKIKIDRSFVGELGTHPQAAAIIHAVLGLGRNLGISVVAEGVETREQRDFLIREGCDELQGFLIGAPQPIDRFAGLVREDGRPLPLTQAA